MKNKGLIEDVKSDLSGFVSINQYFREANQAVDFFAAKGSSCISMPVFRVLTPPFPLSRERMS